MKEVVRVYNDHKGDVDRSDSFTTSYYVSHKHARWTMAVFHYCIKAAISNAWILWKLKNGLTKRCSQTKFLELLINEIVKKYLDIPENELFPSSDDDDDEEEEEKKKENNRSSTTTIMMSYIEIIKTTTKKTIATRCRQDLRNSNRRR
jgi:hypothetical protein